MENWLNRMFEEQKTKDPHLSLRGFARKLDIPPSTICDFLSGKRLLSEKMLRRIAAKLELDSTQTQEWLKVVTLAKVTAILRRQAILSEGETLVLSVNGSVRKD